MLTVPKMQKINTLTHTHTNNYDVITALRLQIIFEIAFGEFRHFDAEETQGHFNTYENH